jgi:hypothetical protein
MSDVAIPDYACVDLKDKQPESWNCVDCGVNTAPGNLNRAELEKAFAADITDQGVQWCVGPDSEMYMVRDRVWMAALMNPMGGCLCIGCLEKRIGRRLKPKDFARHHPFNSLPATERLMKRRGD